MKTYTTAQTLTASAVITALFDSLALVGLFLIQQTAHTIRTACRVSLLVWHWLNRRHDFGDKECGELILTGWQFVGFSLGLFAATFLLSIDWDRTLGL